MNDAGTVEQGIEQKVPLVSVGERNEQKNDTDHSGRQGGFHQRTICQSRYRNLGCRLTAPSSTERDLLHHFAIGSQLEAARYRSTLRKSENRVNTAGLSV